MSKVASEDSVRRTFAKIDEAAGVSWMQAHLDHCSLPILQEPWILDLDVTVKPLYGNQEGAEIGYNPKKPGRPSHTYHTFLVGGLRLVLDVEVCPGNQSASKHTEPYLWSFMSRLPRDRWPSFIRGDCDWGTERNMARCEQEAVPYLFKLRLTKNVRKAIERAMNETPWEDAGQGWWGRSAALRLQGWSRDRRIVILRRQLKNPVVMVDDETGEQFELFAEEGGKSRKKSRSAWEYAVLVTSLEMEILSVAQLYRDRGDAENAFDELKNQWGWGGFATKDLKRCGLMARCIALVYNWWHLFTRLGDPDHHREAITSRPLLLEAVARQTRHAGQKWLMVSSLHGRLHLVRRLLSQIADTLRNVRKNAEQLSPLARWYHLLTTALAKFLKGRKLTPPPWIPRPSDAMAG